LISFSASPGVERSLAKVSTWKADLGGGGAMTTSWRVRRETGLPARRPSATSRFTSFTPTIPAAPITRICNFAPFLAETAERQHNRAANPGQGWRSHGRDGLEASVR